MGRGAPGSPLYDRNRIYGTHVRQRVRHLSIEEVVIAPRSPWQHPYVERLIGSIHRACLEQVIVLHARHVQRLLSMGGYRSGRSRRLHHHYERVAA